MSLQDMLLKPVFSFLGINCQITEWDTILFDMNAGKAYFVAKCALSFSGFPVFLNNCEFSENISWSLSPELSLNAKDFSLSKSKHSKTKEDTMLVSFSIDLKDLEPVLENVVTSP